MDKEQLEIVKYADGEDPKYVVIDDLIEFAPDDVDFDQYEYEYIEIEDAQESNQENNSLAVAKKWNDQQRVGLKTQEEEIKSDGGFIIKLQTDLYYHDIVDKKYKCSNRKCKRNGVAFENQIELDEHNLLHLQQINANECPICNKILANQVKLQNHMTTRHIPKNFTCDNCGKVFRSKDNLRLHMTHHRKHFVIECRACKKTYKSMQSMRYHLRQHFEHHQCEICGAVRRLLL